MKKSFNYLILFVFTVTVLISCSGDDDSTPPVNETPKSEAKQLTSFVFNANNNDALEEDVTAIINEADKTIVATVPYGTDITILQSTIGISEKATVNPTGAQNFSSPIDYTVTAEDNTEAVYEVTVTITAITEREALIAIYNANSDNTLGWDINNPNSDISTWSRVIVGKNGNVVELRMGDTRNIINIPMEIEGLINLTLLDLSENVLQDIPKEIGNLTNLVELDLSNARLKILPKQIGNLENLEILKLYSNELTSIPEEIGNLDKLTSLNLSENNLKTLPEEIFKLKNLTSLSLSFSDLAEIPKDIANLENLTSLYLGYNHFKNIPMEVRAIETLEVLYLFGNDLTEITSEEIEDLPNLTDLRLSYNNLETLPEEIGNLENLIYLDIKYNNLEVIPQAVCDLENTGTLIIKDEGVTCE